MGVYTNPNLNTFKANLSNDEKIQEAKQLIAKANALLDEVKTSPDEEKDVIAKYKEDYCKGKKYYLDSSSEVEFFNDGDSFEKTSWAEFPYQYYLTEELAERAKELKDFNDKLLAFKYCYDSDYEPDWGASAERKYFVYYYLDDGKYRYGWDGCYCRNMNIVYFSSEEIAQKCCDWLNSMKDKEE